MCGIHGDEDSRQSACHYKRHRGLVNIRCRWPAYRVFRGGAAQHEDGTLLPFSPSCVNLRYPHSPRQGNSRPATTWFAVWSIVCVLSQPLATWRRRGRGGVTTLEAWQSKPLPAASHQLPSWAAGGYFYVHTFDGYMYRTSISDGRLTDWQNAGPHAGGPHGYVVLVADNTPYAFRNGHVIRYDLDANRNIRGISCLEWASQSCAGAPGGAFGSIKYMWDSAVYVPLGPSGVHLSPGRVQHDGSRLRRPHPLQESPAPDGPGPFARPATPPRSNLTRPRSTRPPTAMDSSTWGRWSSASGACASMPMVRTGPWETACAYPAGQKRSGRSVRD